MASRTTAARITAADFGGKTSSRTGKKAAVASAPAKKAAVKKAAPSAKAPARKAAVKKAAPSAKAPVKKAAASTPATKAPTKRAAPATTTAARSTAKRARTLVVREDETPWTKAELESVRGELTRELARLREQIADTEEGIADLLRDSGDGAGDDQADAGTKTFEREHEMSLANNARDLLLQNGRALERLEDGTYGVCENCGRPIGKLRLQAFPRATLCLVCKQAEERR